MSIKQRTQRQYSDPAEAFEARTEWDDKGCLIWVGSRNKGGYGVMRADGKNVYSHRWAYTQKHGTIPQGLKIDHMCYDRACCNVAHLQTVTVKQNQENRAGLDKSNTTGRRNVYWYKRLDKWYVQVMSAKTPVSGGYYPMYELHVAEYNARKLRDKLFTNHDTVDNLAPTT